VNEPCFLEALISLALTSQISNTYLVPEHDPGNSIGHYQKRRTHNPRMADASSYCSRGATSLVYLAAVCLSRYDAGQQRPGESTQVQTQWHIEAPLR
jgi:hypothetical protein